MISFGEVGVGDYMGITGDGKVGISTNSPTAKLQIGGGTDGKLFYTDGLYNDVTFNGGSGGTNGVWEFVNSGTWGQTRMYVQDANNVAGRLTFDFRGNAGSNKILAGDSTGKVGIGITAPDTLLHIKNTGSGGTTTLKLEDNAREMYLGRDSIKVTALDGSTSAQLYINSNVTFSGSVTGITTLNASSSLTTGYGVAFTNGNTNFLQYNNSGEDVLYLRDTTNAQMLQTWSTTSTTIHKPLYVTGDVRTADGTVASPAFRFTSDTNTGIYRKSEDYMAFVASGYERFAANGNGLDLSGGSVNKIVHNNTSTRDKYRLWNTAPYSIGMQSSFTFGGLNSYAMTFQMNNQDDRGFWWGDDSHGQNDGAMALTGHGKLTIAHSARIGYGEENDTTTPGATYRLDVSGSIGATADVVAYISSDKRLKDNIKNIANPLDKLNKLNGVEFDWNDKQDLYKGHDIGVIAQEVEEVLPEIVDTREDGHKAVKYDRMVALLIEAVKEQQQQINELKEKLNG
jgi:hypothetical protein